MYIIQKQPPEVFCEKGVPTNLTKFTGKHLCQSLFFNKVPGSRPATLLKKRIWHWCFPVNFAKFLRTPFLTEHLRWLLLIIIWRFWIRTIFCSSFGVKLRSKYFTLVFPKGFVSLHLIILKNVFKKTNSGKHWNKWEHWYESKPN